MKKIYIKLIILGIIIAILSVCIHYILRLNTNTLNNDVIVNIPNGSGAKSIANILEKNGIVKNSSAFVWYIKSKDAASSLRPGVYTFSSGDITFNEILSKLQEGGDENNTINITIPEGYTVTQIAELLETTGLTTKDAFLDYAANLEIPYDYIEKGSDYRQLEGFLFPETYNVNVKWTEKELINMMLAQFDKMWTDEYQKRADELGLSVKDVITIASLIEREAKVSSERATISSVIHNRLNIDMLLQIDATIQYALGKQKSRLYYKDLEIDSPYNTYKHKGLPPTPIASPGSSCIYAALYPETTDYLYYRTKKSNNGEHYFSKTLQEHEAYGNQ